MVESAWWASSRLPWRCHRRARLAVARNSHERVSCPRATKIAFWKQASASALGGATAPLKPTTVGLRLQQLPLQPVQLRLVAAFLGAFHMLQRLNQGA